MPETIWPNPRRMDLAYIDDHRGNLTISSYWIRGETSRSWISDWDEKLPKSKYRIPTDEDRKYMAKKKAIDALKTNVSHGIWGIQDRRVLRQVAALLNIEWPEVLG